MGSRSGCCVMRTTPVMVLPPARSSVLMERQSLSQQKYQIPAQLPQDPRLLSVQMETASILGTLLSKQHRGTVFPLVATTTPPTVSVAAVRSSTQTRVTPILKFLAMETLSPSRGVSVPMARKSPRMTSSPGSYLWSNKPFLVNVEIHILSLSPKKK